MHFSTAPKKCNCTTLWWNAELSKLTNCRLDVTMFNCNWWPIYTIKNLPIAAANTEDDLWLIMTFGICQGH